MFICTSRVLSGYLDIHDEYWVEFLVKYPKIGEASASTFCSARSARERPLRGRVGEARALRLSDKIVKA